LGVDLLVLIAVSAVAAYELHYAQRIYPGVRVANIPLAGLSLGQAATLIEDLLTPYPGPTVTLRYAGQSWVLTPADLGLEVDPLATAAAAYAIGRQGMASAQPMFSGPYWLGLAADLQTQWQALRNGYVVTPTLRHDPNKAIYALKCIAQEVDLPPREGTVTISGLEITGVAGTPGRRMNLEATLAAVTQVAQQGGVVELSIEERQPAIVSVEQAMAKARGLLSRPLTLVAEGVDGRHDFAVNLDTLRQWLVFAPLAAGDGALQLDVALDTAKVTAYLQEIAGRLNRPARDARLDFDPASGQAVVLSPSQAGQALDVEASLAAIEAALLAPDPRTDSPAPRQITLTLTVLPPQVDSQKVAEMGIVELVSQGTTYFAGSSPPRVHNIVTAAEKLRGVVIPPGQVFSFNQHVGDITAENGFEDSLIIWGDRTAVGIGGGVCQVSTTLFRAAFWGGFPIVERWAHGYVVSWYGEPGLDATIYTPDVDFRFRNDTDHFLLIKPEVDLDRGRLTFYLYGTRPDRKVEIDKPVVSNIRPPEGPLYQEDPTLPSGVIRQVEWAKDGRDVLVRRRVIYGDGRVANQEFVSHYRPWRAVFLYGPGTELPPAARAEPTPTPTP